MMSGDLKKVSVAELEKAIGSAVAGLIGGEIECRTGKVDYDRGDFELNLGRSMEYLLSEKG